MVHDFFYMAQPSPGNPGSQSPVVLGLAMPFPAGLQALLVPYLELAGRFTWRLVAVAVLLSLICTAAGALVPGIPVEELGLTGAGGAVPYLPQEEWQWLPHTSYWPVLLPASENPRLLSGLLLSQIAS